MKRLTALVTLDATKQMDCNIVCRRDSSMATTTDVRAKNSLTLPDCFVASRVTSAVRRFMQRFGNRHSTPENAKEMEFNGSNARKQAVCFHSRRQTDSPRPPRPTAGTPPRRRILGATPFQFSSVSSVCLSVS